MKSFNVTLKIWRQASKNDKGEFVTLEAEVSPDMSFLEMLDGVNETLISEGKEPVAFESDCREGICGACSLVINGIPHGPSPGTTTCQLHMRSFKAGDTITVEPFRAQAFPTVKDLVVERSAFDRIIQAGGFISANTGGAQDANSILVSQKIAEKAFDAAACIGCGACVAACKNASAMLFVSAKVSHLAHLPQGHPERKDRVENMIMTMEQEQFGSCTNTLECEAVCPKEINTEVIGKLNQELMKAMVSGK
ncbi:MAG: succinate dehydrogenase/fumarate reductase iron-sulfur subunit [Myxococcales bacterium]|nr:succinate dehydrogenase/fumarate reductase iron-sulfur subunit [Myxococcales bacterium]USN51155.1 MAG: succinate dehydrogenase/fumarate reductase iron-sulfur subunit [Myxococcales bacterium]